MNGKLDCNFCLALELVSYQLHPPPPSHLSLLAFCKWWEPLIHEAVGSQAFCEETAKMQLNTTSARLLA